MLDLVVNFPSIDADAGWVVLQENWPRNTLRLVASQGSQISMSPGELIQWQFGCCLCAAFRDNQEPDQETTPTAPCQNPVSNCPGDLGLKSHIAFPIRVGTRNLGMILLAWHSPSHITPVDYDLLIAIGKQVGLGLRNAQLYQTAAQSDRLRLLNQLSAAAGSSLEMDVILNHILELTCHSITATGGAILQIDSNQDCLVFSHTYGEDSEHLRWKKLAYGVGIAGWVAENRQIACINDTHQDPRWFRITDEKAKSLTLSILSAPLFYRGEVTGVIEIMNKQQGDFTQEDINLLESVAAITSVAMENARMFAATRSRAQELETLVQIGKTLTASLDIKEVVINAISQVQQLFQATGVALVQVDDLGREIISVNALLEEKAMEFSLPIPLEENSIIGRAIQFREAVLIKDVSTDTNLQEWAGKWMFWATTGSVMATPMLSTSKVVGVLLVASREARHFTLANLRSLQAITSTLTIALENARLYENLKTLLHERELAQAKIIQTEKMAAIGRLSASIAHEINNPLQAIQGCLTLFSEETNSADRKDKLDRYMSIVQGEIERITTIVNRMRDYYLPEKNDLQLVDLHSCLDVVLDLTYRQFRDRNIVVRRNWSDQPILLQANRDQMKQVFLNLALNAMDAMSGEGILTVTTRVTLIEQKLDLPVPAAQIEFQDTGMGMTPETRAQIFEPFFTTKEYGSGLGLSIAYEIIKTHQGEFRVSSMAGIGTTITILLPLEQG